MNLYKEDKFIDSEWIKLGNEYSNIKSYLNNLFYQKLSIYKKTITYKYYDFDGIIMNLSSYLDSKICKYYPSHISEIDKHLIIGIFYTTSNIKKTNIKTIIEIKNDIDMFYKNIKEFLIEHIKYTKYQLNGLDNLFNKIKKKIQKIEYFEISLNPSNHQ